jgi:hypothetical protein
LLIENIVIVIVIVPFQQPTCCAGERVAVLSMYCEIIDHASPPALIYLQEVSKYYMLYSSVSLALIA